MLYGAEIWGFNCDSSLENVHMFACKQFLNMSSGVCNDAVRGDLGRFPMHIFAIKRCMSYWLRIISMHNNRHVKLCYETLIFYDNLCFVAGCLTLEILTVLGISGSLSMSITNPCLLQTASQGSIHSILG